MEWGSTSLSSYSYISTAPIRVADQQPAASQQPEQAPQQPGQVPQPQQPQQPVQQPAAQGQQPDAQPKLGQQPPAPSVAPKQAPQQVPANSPATPPPAGQAPASTATQAAKGAQQPSAPTPAPKGQGGGNAPPKSSTLSSLYSSPYSFDSKTLPPFPTLYSNNPPDVLLLVPTIGVKRIELDVDNLAVDINLNAQVAGLVTINAGIAASIQLVNLTISDVGAELELVIRLKHLADIVQRVFESLDLVSFSIKSKSLLLANPQSESTSSWNCK